MWRWDDSAGELSRDGKLIARGYSGRDYGLNNPDATADVGIGPIPLGKWLIAALHETGASTGPYTLVLEPMTGTDTHGRSAFRIHGDNVKLDHSASHGCIILPRLIRELIWKSRDTILEVVS